MDREAVFTLALAIQANIPVCLYGVPGVGKTSIIRQMAASLGWSVVEVNPSFITDPSDLTGIPVPSGEVTLYHPPMWVYDLICGRYNVLLIDEINTAPRHVQPILLSMLLDCRIGLGGAEFPRHVRRVAAMNPPEYSAGGSALNPALASRMLHIRWEADAKAFTRYMQGDPLEIPTLPDGWDKDIGETYEKIVAFLHVRPELLCDEKQAKSGTGWPNPRTWRDYGARALHAARKLVGLSDDLRAEVEYLALGGCVGVGAAQEYLTWEREANLPNPYELLQNPSLWQPNEQRPDIAYAVANSVAYAADELATQEAYLAAWRVLERIARHEAGENELGLLATHALDAAQRLERMRFAKGFSVAPQVALYRELLAAAGAL